MLSNHRDPTAGKRKRPDDELRKLAIADHSNARVPFDSHSLEDSECRGEWLNEHRLVIAYRFGHLDEIARRQGQELGERPVAILDAQDGSCRAMSRVSCRAGIAEPTPRVDLPDDSFACERGIR